MASVESLILRITALGGHAAAAEVTGVEGAVTGLGKVARFAGGVAGLGGLAFGLADVTKTAIAFQTQQGQLSNSLKKTGQYSADNMNRLVESADKLATHGGLVPQKNLEMLQRLLDATHNVNKSMVDMNMITGLVRGGYGSYTAILRAVLNVEQGRTTGLGRLAIVMKPVHTATLALTAAHTKAAAALALAQTGAHKLTGSALLLAKAHMVVSQAAKDHAKAMDVLSTKHAAMAKLMNLAKGRTEAFSHSAAGALSNFRNTIDVLMQHVGKFALPGITAFIHILTQGLQALPKVAHWLKDHALLLEHIGITAAGTALAYGLWTVAVNASTIAVGAAMFAERGLALAMLALDAVPMIAAFAAVAAVIYLLVTHFGEVKAVVGDVFNAMKTAATDAFKAVKGAVMDAFHAVSSVVSTVVDFIGNHWKLLVVLLTGPIGLVALTIAHHFNFIKGVVMDVANFFVNRFNWVKDGTVKAFNDIKTFAVQTFTALVRLATGPMQLLWKVLTWPITMFIAGVTTIWSKIQGPLSSLAGLAKGAMNDLWTILTWPFREAIKIAGQLWTWIQKLLGPLSTIVNGIGKVASGIGGAASGAFDFLTGGATGGVVDRGGDFMVGEKGRERVYLPTGSLIVPHHFVNTGMNGGGGGGTPVENHVSLQIDGTTFARMVQYSLGRAKAVG